VNLSVVLITHNEETNLPRTLESVMPLVGDGRGEIIVVDCGSTDRTVEIAKSFGAKVFIENWKGYAGQKNSAIDKASANWILSLDADEEVSSELAHSMSSLWQREPVKARAFYVPRRNFFLGRWIKHGGFWPDRKLRLFRRGAGRFEDRPVHEDVRLQEAGDGSGDIGRLEDSLLHHAYPTLSDYLEHMNHYSSLGAKLAASQGQRRFSILNIVLRPLATFSYNYFLRLGFLDGREGLLLHLYHAAYVSWKYAKAWELGRGKSLSQ
jgi:glycosyltransferase involved in cell wall biosynthesis